MKKLLITAMVGLLLCATGCAEKKDVKDVEVKTKIFEEANEKPEIEKAADFVEDTLIELDADSFDFNVYSTENTIGIEIYADYGNDMTISDLLDMGYSKEDIKDAIMYYDLISEFNILVNAVEYEVNNKFDLDDTMIFLYVYINDELFYAVTSDSDVIHDELR